MFLGERFPMFPSIFMDKVHSYDRNEYKKEPHDTKAPRGLHNRSNQEAERDSFWKYSGSGQPLKLFISLTDKTNMVTNPRQKANSICGKL